MKIVLQFILLFVFSLWLNAKNAQGQTVDLKSYNIVWTNQSQNSSESMPCGGGDIGLNVWVEMGEILFYLSRSGAFDENNVFPKFGRVRLKLTPNPFDGVEFRQELKLKEGNIEINGNKGRNNCSIKIWVDVFRPVVHVETECNQPVTVEAIYENWRISDLEWTKRDQTKASLGFRDAPVHAVIRKDSIGFEENKVLFYHRNRDESLFDITVHQQGLDPVKDQLWNPLKNLTFGGMMVAENMKPAGTTSGKYADTEFKGWKLKSVKPSKKSHLKVYLHIDNSPSIEAWENGLVNIEKENTAALKTAAQETLNWWNDFWNRSYIVINPDKPDIKFPEWQVGRNYQLFRYQLGCNAYGNYPTKFNGGMFTFDPVYIDKNLPFTPDHRDWGGGTHTQQNQRLVYFPMFKSGDFDMLPSQLNFYLRALRNAEIRTEFYWGHKGPSFSEQLEHFGLPLATSYGWNRPDYFPKGMEYNYWLEYHWDSQMEFCLMMLDVERFTGEDISKYIPFIESCLTFFDEHYRMEAQIRGRQVLDGEGHLVLYPGTGAETYKMAYNSTSTIAGLQTVLTRLLELPDKYLSAEKRKHWEEMLKTIPPIAFREKEGHLTISPAWVWARINNQEIPQLYPVYPWGMYGIGKPDLEVAINTWKYGTDEARQKNHISWHQDAIFCARLGLTDEAAAITIKKLQDSERRYPTFWGPGHDWVPDHNWGGSGMIGLQEMLMQTDGKKIYLFPAWPKDWDVSFKLHAPYNTTVEGILKNGQVVSLKVIPESRRNDIASCTPIINTKPDKITVSAYYFANYHTDDPRNIIQKGASWSEWELVKAAQPRFPGHQQPKVPAWGYSDEKDPKVMKQKIEAAADNGIDCFIFDWYMYEDGPFLNRCIDEGFLKAENCDRIKFGLMWANHDWVDIHPYTRGAEQKLLYPGKVSPKRFDEICDFVIREYFTKPNYWKIDGKAYFSVYDVQKFVEGFGSMEATKAAMDHMRTKAIAAGLKGVHWNLVAWGNPVLPVEKAPSNTPELIKMLGFDSATSYVWVHHVGLPDRQTEYNKVRDEYFTYWDKAKKEYPVQYIPNVTMGWDPSPRCDLKSEWGNFGYPFTNTMGNNTPENFKMALKMAKDKLLADPDGPRILNINCWNEWTEGSYLEPDAIHGMAYLKAVKEVFK